MTAPTETVVEAVTDEPTVEIIDEQAGEMRVRFPVLVIEGLDTSDGRYIEPDALTHRALPLSLLAQTESAHGGDEPGPAMVVGRIDSMTRVPGPDVVSRRTGEPFPDGTFIWQATGAIDATGHVADLVRRGFLRGVSVDLVGMDYDIVGEDGFLDEANPARQLITHRAEIAAATLVPIPAFGDAYVELDEEDVPPAPLAPEDIPDELLSSAVPAWRSAEVGDECGLCLAGLLAAAVGERMVARIPENAVEQFTEVIDSGEERDAVELATALVQHIADNWAADLEEDPDDDLAPGYEPDAAVTAAADEPHTGGMIALIPADTGALVVEGGDPAEELHLTLAYLGEDVTGWDAEQTGAVLDAVRQLAEVTPPVEAEIMGHAAFNPGDANDFEPCAVYLVSGEMLPALKGEAAAFDVSEHPVFLPHITAGYGLEPGALNYVGPVVFDRLRVALADEVTDYPLGEAITAAAPTAEERRRAAEDGDAMPDGSFPIRNGADLENAIHAVGRAKDNHAAVRRHIMRRARELGMEDRIPATWKGDGTLDESANTTDAEALADIDDESVAVDDEVGIPDAPQPCEYGDHPAVRSLLFDGGNQYVPVCDEHEQEARDRIAADGGEITGVVEIEQPDDEDTAVVAAAAPRPPAAWFTDPQLDGPTPLTVDEDGRIRGHAAVFGTCHIGFPQQCVTAPRSRSGYAYFTTGAVLTDDGEVPVGSITMDTGHAPTSMSRQTAAAHYDHTGAAVADVAVGEDAHGIWVAGALRAGVDEQTAARLRASALSGDWRRVGGNLELVALLAVNVPGFPVPRARVASGEPLALVAAGALRPGHSIESIVVGKLTSSSLGARLGGDPLTFRADPAGFQRYEDLADAIAARLEQRQQAGELSARHAALVAELDDSPDRAAALLAELDDSPQRAAELLAALDGDVDEAEVADYISRMPPQLRESYLRGEVAARIRWGTPGDFTRCVAQARHHDVPARMRDGMCAQLHHDATGLWPGDRRNP